MKDEQQQQEEENAQDEDRLRSIHDELSSSISQQEQQQSLSSSSSSSPWLPLESNPEIFTSFARRVGSLPIEWEFVDVFGLDDELLQLIPRPIAAIILLFPCTEKIYEFRAIEKRQLVSAMMVAAQGGEEGSTTGGRGGGEREEHNNMLISPATRKAYHVEQVASFGNACGTIAAVHSLTNAGLLASSSSSSSSGTSANSSSSSSEAPHISGPLAAFRDSTSHLPTPRERGKVLVSSGVLHNLSDEAATNIVAQTICPNRGDTRLGHHYCAFVPIPVVVSDDDSKEGTTTTTMHLVELDGTKVSPVDHGPIMEKDQDFLQATVSVIKERWMKLEPERIDFSIMALAKTKTETTTSS